MTNIQSSTLVQNYNDMAYASKLVKFSDFMSNKNNIVHKKLYNMAIDKYIKEWLLVKQGIIEMQYIQNKMAKFDGNNEQKEELYQQYNKLNQFITYHKEDKKYVDGKLVFEVNSLKEFKDNCFIYEIMNDEYWKPSLCKIITKMNNRRKTNMNWTVDLKPYWNTYQDNLEKTFRKYKLSDKDFNDAKIIDINYIRGKAKLYSENIDKEFEVDFDEINGNDIDIDDSLSLKTTFNYLLSQK